MNIHFHKPILILIFVLPWFILLFSREIRESIFLNSAYWVLTIYVFGLLYFIYRSFNFDKFSRYSISKFCNKLTLFSLVISTVLLLIYTNNKSFYKTLSDEANLLSISRSLLFEKKPFNQGESVYLYHNLNTFRKDVPKRHLLYPYLVNILHVVLGYDWRNAFILNQSLLFLLFYSISFFFSYRFGLISSLFCTLIVASSPLLYIYSNSGGFDFISLCFFWFTFLFAFFSREKFNFIFLSFWLGIGVTQVRYENSLLLFVSILAFFLLYRPSKSYFLLFYKKAGFNRIFLSLNMLNCMLLLAVLQTSLSLNKMENKGKELLSLDHFFNHFPIFIYSFLEPVSLGVNHPLPYRPFLWWILIFALTFYFFSNFSKYSLSYLKSICLSRNFLYSLYFSLFITVAVQLFIFLCHFHGIATEPIVFRYFLPISFFGGFFLCILLLHLLSFSLRPFLLGMISIFMFLSFIPTAQENRSINSLTLVRETKHIYDTILSDYPKNTLYISVRPREILVLERGVITPFRANREFSKFLNYLRDGRVQEIIYFRRSDSEGSTDQNLLQKGNWIEDKKFMIRPGRQLSVLRLETGFD